MTQNHPFSPFSFNNESKVKKLYYILNAIRKGSMKKGDLDAFRNLFTSTADFILLKTFPITNSTKILYFEDDKQQYVLLAYSKETKRERRYYHDKVVREECILVGLNDDERLFVNVLNPYRILRDGVHDIMEIREILGFRKEILDDEFTIDYDTIKEGGYFRIQGDLLLLAFMTKEDYLVRDFGTQLEISSTNHIAQFVAQKLSEYARIPVGLAHSWFPEYIYSFEVHRLSRKQEEQFKRKLMDLLDDFRKELRLLYPISILDIRWRGSRTRAFSYRNTTLINFTMTVRYDEFDFNAIAKQLLNEQQEQVIRHGNHVIRATTLPHRVTLNSRYEEIGGMNVTLFPRDIFVPIDNTTIEVIHGEHPKKTIKIKGFPIQIEIRNTMIDEVDTLKRNKYIVLYYKKKHK